MLDKQEQTDYIPRMPYKQQQHCYRTIGGTRYINWCDVLGDEEAKIAAGVKARRIKHRLVKHPDGFSSLFVPETVDQAVITEILEG